MTATTESTATGTRSMKYWQGINEALVEELERDERVVLAGEDIARAGGPYGVTRGLFDRFGENRVRDTPISEAVIVGLGIGAAAVGLRPVVEIMFFDFTMLAADQIVNQAAKFRFFTAGHSLPLTIRTMCGAGGPNGAQHSQNIEDWFCQVPGLKVVMPSTPRDVKGLLKSSIRDDDPVLFIETLGLLPMLEDVPDDEGDLLLPLGVADIKREGTDVTVVATGRLVARALAAAEQVESEGISVEVIDPRTLQPLDTETILASVHKTNRLVVAHEGVRPYGFGAEIAALAAEQAFDYLDAPIERVASPFSHIPTPPPLVEARAPGDDAVVAAIKNTLARSG
jgi:acetoin:2,6-dichlorophenolindophenol oxidoreductase subunit beta